MKRTIFKPSPGHEKIADKWVEEHKLACRKANSHCVYSDKTYSESCLKCFALWLLDNKIRISKK